MNIDHQDKNMKFMSMAVALGSLVLCAPSSAGQQDLLRKTANGDAVLDMLIPTRGVVRARQTLKVSPEDVVRIEELPFAVGAEVRKGDVVVSYACSKTLAIQKKAKAELKAKAAALAAEKRLHAYGAAGSLSVAGAEGLVRAVEADLLHASERVKACNFRSPFHALVSEVRAQPGEIAQPAEPVLTLESIEDLEVVFVVPSRGWKSLPGGRGISIKLDETGRNYAAVVSKRAAIIDPVSQSARLSARIEAADSDIRPGMSGDITFSNAKVE